MFACCRVIYDITWSWFSYFVLYLGTLRPKGEISASNLGIARFFLVSSSGLLSKGFGLNLRLKINSTFCLKFHKHHLGMKFISVLRNGINGRFIRVFCRLFYIITFIFGSFGINSLKTLNSVFQVLDILRENNNFVIKKKSLSDISSKMVLSIDAVLDLVWVIRPYTS